MDRYNHDIGDDTDDTDDSPLFGSFSSYSPQSRKISQSKSHLATESELDFAKKQLFPNELERTISQMSPSSSVSISPPTKLTEKIKGIDKTTPMKSSPLVKSENSDTSSGNPAAATPSVEAQLKIVRNDTPGGTSICFSTPDSSQTESDDISPQIQRKRHVHSRDKLPRFSISIHGDET